MTADSREQGEALIEVVKWRGSVRQVVGLISFAACLFAAIRTYILTLPNHSRWPVQVTAYSWIAGLLTLSLLTAIYSSVLYKARTMSSLDLRMHRIGAYVWLIGSLVPLMFLVLAAATAAKPFTGLSLLIAFPFAIGMASLWLEASQKQE